jgi:hypothetical protein
VFYLANMLACANIYVYVSRKDYMSLNDTEKTGFEGETDQWPETREGAPPF